MGLFASRERPAAAGRDPGGGDDVPPPFKAVAEALAMGTSPVGACSVLGGALARDGASLVEVLEGLRGVWQRVRGREPAYDAVLAASTAWSEATLAYLHQQSCEDPMTGLASLAHVRSRLSELYRGEFRESGCVRDRATLVVVDLPPQTGDALGRDLRLARVADTVRTVFAGGDVVGRATQDRVLVLTDRDPRLARRVQLLGRILATLHPGAVARIWIEGLAPTDAGSAALLDELARA